MTDRHDDCAIPGSSVDIAAKAAQQLTLSVASVRAVAAVAEQSRLRPKTRPQHHRPSAMEA